MRDSIDMNSLSENSDGKQIRGSQELGLGLGTNTKKQEGTFWEMKKCLYHGIVKRTLADPP